MIFLIGEIGWAGNLNIENNILKRFFSNYQHVSQIIPDSSGKEIKYNYFEINAKPEEIMNLICCGEFEVMIYYPKLKKSKKNKNNIQEKQIPTLFIDEVGHLFRQR